MAYTHEDFLRELNRTGAKLSQADMETAKKFPEFGISLISLGEDFNKATTPEQRTLAHEAAEELRRSYGGYSGGEDGSGYIALPKQETQSSAVQLPEYKNPYAEQQAALLEEVMNREGFSWNKEDDPNWSSYKKSYLREGDRASANALAQAAAASGGRPSTFAMTAAGQAGDYYAAQLNDIIPKLEQQSYDRYVDEDNRLLQKLDAVNAQEQMAYTKHLNELGRADTIYARELAALERENQQEKENQAFAQAQVDSIIEAGGKPSAELVAASGYSNEYIAALTAAMNDAKGVTTTPGGRGYDNGNLTGSQVKELQVVLGVEADGFYGPATQAAAGGLNAEDAFALYIGDGPVEDKPIESVVPAETTQGSVDLSDIQPGIIADIRSRMMEIGPTSSDEAVRARALQEKLNALYSAGSITMDQAARIAEFYGF